MSTSPFVELSSSQKSSLANEIIECLHELSRTLLDERNNKSWTAKIKTAFAELADRNNFNYRPRETYGQWLFDFLWFRDDGNGCFSELSLALESEWSPHFEDILNDFEKLLIAKAPLKVMVFQDGGKDALDKMWSMLHARIAAFAMKVPNETYILAAFMNGPRTFQIKWVYNAKENCALVDAPPPSRSSLRTRENAA